MKGIATNMAEERKRHSRSTRAASTRNTVIHVRVGDAAQRALAKADDDNHFESRTMLIEWLLHCYDVGKIPLPPIRVTKATSPLRPKAVTLRQQQAAWYMRPPVVTANGNPKLTTVLAMTPAERKALGLKGFDDLMLDHDACMGPGAGKAPGLSGARTAASSAACHAQTAETTKAPAAPPVIGAEAIHDVVFESLDPRGGHDDEGILWPMERTASMPEVGDSIRVWRPSDHIANVDQDVDAMKTRRPHWYFNEILRDPSRPGIMTTAGFNEHGSPLLAPLA